MDQRRLDTGQVLAAGIIDKPIPETDVPEDRERVGVDIYDGECNRENVTTHLLAGAVVDCSEYYGIPVAWKDGETFKAILLQYRSVSESHTFATVEEAAGWFVDTAHAVSG